jgi:hypothetical protein
MLSFIQTYILYIEYLEEGISKKNSLTKYFQPFYSTYLAFIG